MNRALFCLTLLFSLLLAGCGGSSSTSTATPATKGTATINIKWPAPVASKTRVIPEASNSITVVIQLGTKTVASGTITKPATSWSSPALTPANYTLTANAYSSTSGTGVAQASGVGAVTIVANTNTPSSVTMGSTVIALTIMPTSVNVAVGGTVQLGASATDASNNIVLVAPDTVQWVSSNTAFATVPGTGLTPLLTGVLPGSCNVSATFTEVEPSLGQSPVKATAIPVNVVTGGGAGLANSAWLKFRGGGLNTGVGPGSGATGASKWSTTLSTNSYASSLIVGLSETIFVGCEDGTVSSLAASTGTKNWSVSTGTGKVYLTAASDGTLFASCSDVSLKALSSSNGSTYWTYSSGSPTSNTSPALGSDGTLYYAAGDGKVYAISLGAQKWVFQAGSATDSSPALGANGTLYVCSSGTLYAINSATGAKIWTAAVGTNATTPAIGSDGSVYVGSKTDFFSFNGTTGAVNWTFATGTAPSSAAVSPLGNIYFTITAPSGLGTDVNVYALNAHTGVKVWEESFDDSILGSSLSPTIDAAGVVYVMSLGKVYALNGTTGATNWTGGSYEGVAVDLALDTDGTIFIGGAPALFNPAISAMK